DGSCKSHHAFKHIYCGVHSYKLGTFTLPPTQQLKVMVFPAIPSEKISLACGARCLYALAAAFAEEAIDPSTRAAFAAISAASQFMALFSNTVLPQLFELSPIIWAIFK